MIHTCQRRAPLLLAAVFALSVAGCDQATLLSHPHLAEVGDRIILVAQIHPSPQGSMHVLLQSGVDSRTTWDETGRFLGRPVGVVAHADTPWFVFADGTVVHRGGENGRPVTVVQGSPQRKLRAAVRLADTVYAVDAAQPQQLQVLALQETAWAAVGPPLNLVGTPTLMQLTALDGQPVLCWRTEIGGHREPGLRLARLAQGTWQHLPSPPRPQHGFFALAPMPGGWLLVREPDAALLRGRERLLLDRFRSETWKAVSSGLLLPSRLQGQAARGLACLAARGSLWLALADTGGLHVFVSLDAEGRTWSLVASPFTSSAGAQELWLSLLLLVTLGVGLVALNRWALARREAVSPLPALPVGGLASPLDRAMAMLIDGVLILPLPLCYFAIGGDWSVLTGSPEQRLTFCLVGLGGLSLYMAIAEARWGQTVGKRLFGLRVRSAGRGRISAQQSLIRNLVRFVDFWPIVIGGFELPYLVALLCVAFTPRRQRLGDLLARTVVQRHTPVSKRQLVLASGSTRREELMHGLGLLFTVAVPDIDETLYPQQTPEENAVRLALEKARAVARERPGREIIIAADTLVAAEGEIVGKPADREHARAILTRLSGSTHQVLTAVAVIDRATGQQLAACEHTDVEMKAMTPEEIAAYVESGEADGKAGAYAIQETGDQYITSVRGSLSNVIGMPMELLLRMLDELEG